MKQFFALLLIATLSNAAHSQLSAGMHAGASNKNTVMGIHTQYMFKNKFTVGGAINAHLDQTNPVFFQSRFGYTLGNSASGLSVQPYMGYSYGLQNVEQKNQGGHFTTGAQFRYQFDEVALLYVDFNSPAPKYFMITVGIAGRFLRGCE
jgi:hypothetical protein